MANAYSDLVESNVWDKDRVLPLVPMHLNPHIYAAYAVRVLESLGWPEALHARNIDPSNEKWPLTSAAFNIRDHYKDTFLKDCEKEPGLLYTYPDRGVASHDDAHGAAFLNQGFAERCVTRLMVHDGSYTDGVDSENKNQYRFIFFLPSLRAFAQFRVGILSQLEFIAALLTNLWFTKDGSTDGHLLLWLAFPEMKKNALTSVFIYYWADQWTKRGYTPKTIFTSYYLTECPWFAKYARNDWE